MGQRGTDIIDELLFNQLFAVPNAVEDFTHRDGQQLAKISAAMEKRLSRKVKLNCKIDKSVMAGVIIRAGDMVIDGSVRGRLERLADVLQS